MIFWIASAMGLAAAYLLGATPTAYVAGKALKAAAFNPAPPAVRAAA